MSWWWQPSEAAAAAGPVPDGPYEEAVFADSPAFLLPMDEPSGNLTDIVGSKTGTVSGSPTYGVSGPIAGHTAMGFASSSDYVTVSDHADLDLGNGPFTIEYWLARDTDTGLWQIVLNKGTNGYSTGVGSASDAAYSDRYTLGKRGIAVIGYNGSATVPADGSWHHVAITRSGTGGASTHKVYADGVEKTWTVYASGDTVDLADTSDALEIAREGAGSTVAGKLAYIALYKSVLSGDRIAAHYAAAQTAETSEPPPYIGGGYYWGFWARLRETLRRSRRLTLGWSMSRRWTRA